MNDFQLYFKLGLNHVLDLQGYDHMLFLIVLVLSYTFKDWKKLLWLVSLFTAGHTFSLLLSSYKLLNANMNMVEFLIPFTIMATAISNLLLKGKTTNNSKFGLIITFCFGWIHGLGFSNYLGMLLSQQKTKLAPVLEFALGIEAAQIIVVLVIIGSYWILEKLFKISKRDWVLVLSAMVIGITIPILMERWPSFINSIF